MSEIFPGQDGDQTLAALRRLTASMVGGLAENFGASSAGAAQSASGVPAESTPAAATPTPAEAVAAERTHHHSATAWAEHYGHHAQETTETGDDGQETTTKVTFKPGTTYTSPFQRDLGYASEAYADKLDEIKENEERCAQGERDVPTVSQEEKAQLENKRRVVQEAIAKIRNLREQGGRDALNAADPISVEGPDADILSQAAKDGSKIRAEREETPSENGRAEYDPNGKGIATNLVLGEDGVERATALHFEATTATRPSKAAALLQSAAGYFRHQLARADKPGSTVSPEERQHIAEKLRAAMNAINQDIIADSNNRSKVVVKGPDAELLREALSDGNRARWSSSGY